MGLLQRFTYHTYGMILSQKTNPHKDVLLGLQLVSAMRNHNDSSNPNHIGGGFVSRSVWWIGCDVGNVFNSGLPKFYPQAPLGVWLATDPYVAPIVATPPDAKELATAKAEWEKFEQWCFARGVDIRGRGQLLVVNDYD